MTRELRSRLVVGVVSSLLGILGGAALAYLPISARLASVETELRGQREDIHELRGLVIDHIKQGSLKGVP